MTGSHLGLNKVNKLLNLSVSIAYSVIYLLLAVPMNIFDIRMNGFSTETAVCLQTLHYSVPTGVANAFYAPMFHIINCNEVVIKSFAFQESRHNPFKYVVR